MTRDKFLYKKSVRFIASRVCPTLRMDDVSLAKLAEHPCIQQTAWMFNELDLVIARDVRNYYSEYVRQSVAA